MNMLEEHHPNARMVDTETVTNLGAITGIKRKREMEPEKKDK